MTLAETKRLEWTKAREQYTGMAFYIAEQAVYGRLPDAEERQDYEKRRELEQRAWDAYMDVAFPSPDTAAERGADYNDDGRL